MDDLIVGMSKLAMVGVMLLVVILVILRPARRAAPITPIAYLPRTQGRDAVGQRSMEQGASETNALENSVVGQLDTKRDALALSGGNGQSLALIEGGSAGTNDAAVGEAAGEEQSLEAFKEKLKQAAPKKKTAISAEMLDTSASYDDKVAMVRMLISEDSGRVANVIKGMMKSNGVK
jgi:hypothetical protein